MPIYRVTVRHGQSRYQYHVEDVEAAHLGEAMAQAAQRLPAEVARSADVAEVRRLVEPENRGLAPG
jgi:ribosomal protein L16/L10AE